jgi:hypothetical protein
MTPQELHIQVNQDLQRVASYVYDDFEVEEIDIVLNKMQDRFIDDKVKRDAQGGGFQVDQVDLDNLRSVLVSDVELPVYVDTVRKQGFIIFPDDYRYLIRDSSLIFKTCIKPEDSEYFLLDTTPIDALSSTLLPFPKTTETSTPYSEVVIQYNGNTLFTLADYPELSSGLEEPEQRFIILNLILDSIRREKPTGLVGAYWETYDKVYKKDSFILVSDPTAVLPISITVDGTTTTGVTSSITGLVVSSNTATEEVSNRLTKTEGLSDVKRLNHYTKTIARSPISSIAGNRLYLHFDESFIPTKVIIDYIRIPRKISLPLGISCELAETTHQKICDLAVEFIKNTIEQTSYDSKLRDNMLRSE